MAWSLSAITSTALSEEVSSTVEPVVSAAAPSELEETPSAPVACQPRALFQHSTYPDAWKAAQASNRPILVYVSMPNCHYCEKMKSQVFTLPQVERLVADSFETISADRYTHAKLVSKLHVRWYPTTVLVGPNNKILDVIEGYKDATAFQQRLQTGLASLNNTTVLTQTR